MINKHYHNKEKGCEIIPCIIKPKSRHGYKIQGAYCKSCKTEICKCGWEYRFHYGEDNWQLN